MNQSLQSRGMSATVDRQGERLEVILAAERVPNRQALTAFVQQGIHNLGIQSIASVRIVGQQIGASYPAWMQEIQLGAQGEPSGNLDDLDDLAGSSWTAAPLNIQPETASEITVIPSDDWMESNLTARGVESADLEPSDLSFLPDTELSDLAGDLMGDLAMDELSDADLSNTDLSNTLDDTDDILAALTEPSASSIASPGEVGAGEVGTEIDIAPDFLQELLADVDESERSLFAESPDGLLDTLEGSPEDFSEADMDLLFDDFDQTSGNLPESLPQTTETIESDLSDLDNTADASETSDADLLAFLNQAVEPSFTGSAAEPQGFAIDALLDPAEMSEANLMVDPETPALEQPDRFSDRSDAAESRAFAEVPPSAMSSNPSDSILAGQIEDLFNAELDEPGGAFIEEILPERPSATGEDLRQALVSEAQPADSVLAPLEDPWTVRVLPEVSEARTVLDLPDDDPETGDRPEFMVEPRPDTPDAANASNDLDALFAESEEPPVSMPQLDPIFYDSIADEEIAEEDLEELPPDFLQDFSAEFPDGFPDEFSEVGFSEVGFSEVGFSEVEAPSSVDAEAQLDPVTPDEFALPNDFFADPVEPTLAEPTLAGPTSSDSSDLAAELAALDLTTDPALTDPTFTDPTFTDRAFSDSAADDDLTTLIQEFEGDPFEGNQFEGNQFEGNQFEGNQADDVTAIDPVLAAADRDLEADLEGDLVDQTVDQTTVNLTDTDSTDADLADLLSETPQGRPLETEAIPTETSPPQPEDFFAEPIAPLDAPLSGSASSSASADSTLTESQQPEVSQDALEAGLGDFREGLVEPLPEEFFADEARPSDTDWQADLRDPLDLSDDTEANYIIEDSTPAVVYTPPPLPTSETQATPERGTPGWLFPLVLLFVVAWIAGLLGFAVFRSSFDPLPSPPPAGEPEAPPASPVEPAAPASPTSQQPNPSPVANLTQASPLARAIEQASDAVALTQAAQSADDWGLVASKWQQAMNLLKAIPNTSPDYATAQQKLTEYGANVAAARQKANLPIVAAAPLGAANVAQANSPTSPTVSSAGSPNAAMGVVCSSIAAAPNSQPVELSSVQFDPTVDPAEASPIVGCITNHTEQSIASVNVVYNSSSSATNSSSGSNSGSDNAAEATTEATGNLNFGQLDPKQTVPFKSAFTVTPQVTKLNIAAISWTAAGTSEAKQLPATINITRPNQEG
ncbi:MAG: hypothetical protein HC827_16550 [Cyanobacteria bacterium RM1_2_2]|nr:hypothetical protein [Cyanobacteria bacterium RM1_2_2]